MHRISILTAVVGCRTTGGRTLMPVVGFVHRPFCRPVMLMGTAGTKTVYKAMFRIVGKSAHICSRIASRSGTLVPVMGLVELPIAGYMYMGDVVHVDVHDCLGVVTGIHHYAGFGQIAHVQRRKLFSCKVKLAVCSKFISIHSIEVKLEHICFALTERHAVYRGGTVTVIRTELRGGKSSPITALVIDRHAGSAHGNVVIRHFSNNRFCKVTDVYSINGSLGCGNVLPHCSYGCIGSNGDLVTNCLFYSANAPSLELLTGRSSKGASRKLVFTGNAGCRSHRAGAAVCIKGYGVSGGRNILISSRDSHRLGGHGEGCFSGSCINKAYAVRSSPLFEPLAAFGRICNDGNNTAGTIVAAAGAAVNVDFSVFNGDRIGSSCGNLEFDLVPRNGRRINESLRIFTVDRKFNGVFKFVTLFCCEHHAQLIFLAALKGIHGAHFVIRAVIPLVEIDGVFVRIGSFRRHVGMSTRNRLVDDSVGPWCRNIESGLIRHILRYFISKAIGHIVSYTIFIPTIKFVSLFRGCSKGSHLTVFVRAAAGCSALARIVAYSNGVNDIFPYSRYGNVRSNSNFIANSFFFIVNAPAFKLFAYRFTHSTLGERIFAGDTGYGIHAPAIREGYGVGSNGICRYIENQFSA